MDEGALLTQIAAGSREAFEAFYRRYELRALTVTPRLLSPGVPLR